LLADSGSRSHLNHVQDLEKHLDELADKFIDYLIVDEFHHATAPTYRRVERILNYRVLLGLTATPFRADRQDIALLCDGNIVVSCELRSAVEAGILVSCRDVKGS
jgi:superfamily II DNA or RNA helicase